MKNKSKIVLVISSLSHILTTKWKLVLSQIEETREAKDQEEGIRGEDDENYVFLFILK